MENDKQGKTLNNPSSRPRENESGKSNAKRTDPTRDIRESTRNDVHRIVKP